MANVVGNKDSQHDDNRLDSPKTRNISISTDQLTPGAANGNCRTSNCRKCSMHSRRHSYHFTKQDSNGEHHHHHHHQNAQLSHVVKQLLNHVYGDVDWRKAPGDRNKVDYCARILFPTTFIIFIVCYFVVLLK